MLSKDEIIKVKLACESGNCIHCPLFLKGCTMVLPDTALQLLERVEKLEQLLRDVLVSGNIKSCEREIREFLEGDKC